MERRGEEGRGVDELEGKGNPRRPREGMEWMRVEVGLTLMH